MEQLAEHPRAALLAGPKGVALRASSHPVACGQTVDDGPLDIAANLAGGLERSDTAVPGSWPATSW